MTMESDPKIAGFNLIQTSYKQVGNHAIRADLLVPQTASGKRPVIVRFHGGGLVRINRSYRQKGITEDKDNRRCPLPRLVPAMAP